MVGARTCKVEGIRSYLTLKIYNFYDAREGDCHLKCVLDLQPSVFNKLLGDGTLVSKHVGTVCM